MFGKCKVCVEKDKRLQDLEKQVEFLRNFALPKQNVIPLVQLEADAVMSGRDEVMEISRDEQADAELSERDRIFSGTYDINE